MMKMKRLFLLLFLSMTCFCVQASHIVGGSMGYTFLGLGPNNTFRYKITLTTYTDCSPSSEIPFPEAAVSIGIYFHDPAAPNAPKTLKQTLIAQRIGAETITPPLPPGCSVGLGSCIYKGTYEVEVLLESSAQGYHVYYERCCRNTALVNLQNPSQTSTGFYAFIPPTNITNSTPVFLDDPVPLLCVGDSLTLLNTAIDPDGDMLLYSFTTPYAGFADVSNPAPSPQPTLSWPITPVTYQNNFTPALPFGPGSYTYINALNGLSVYKTSLTGNFAVAVQISEYRNGNLISITRRDMQLISLVCPLNHPPDGNFSAGLDVQLVEGDTTCFEFTYTDPDTDSVFVELGGEPFLSGMPPTWTQHYTAPNSIKGTICWTPPCGSARTLPYFITYKASDDGCMPKERINILKITVVPDTARLVILGDTSVCGLQTAIYHTNKESGTFQWSVTQGNINPASHTSYANVDWNIPQGQQATITVIRNGPCRNDTANLTVQVTEPEFAGYLQDIWLCPGFSKTILAEPGGTDYLWSPSNWLSNPTVYNPVTNTPDSLDYHVVYTDSVGCEKFDSVWVIVNNIVPADAGSDISLCEGLPLTLGGTPTGPADASFNWTPNLLPGSGTLPNPTIQIPQTGWYYVDVSVDTCHATDSVYVTVFPLPPVDAGNDTSICFQSPFQLNGSGIGNMSWNPSGTTLNNTTIANPILLAPAGTYTPILTINSADGCMSSDTVEIEVLALPQIRIAGDSSLCIGDSSLLTANGGTAYIWNSSAFLSSLSTPGTNVFPDSSTWVFVQGTDMHGCISSDSLWVEVFRAKLDLSPDTVLCLGEHITLSYGSPQPAQIHWTPSDYLSSAIGATVVSTPLDHITYMAHATNPEGCMDSATITLWVNPLPVLDADYISKLFCDYVEVKLSSSNLSDSLYWLYQNIPAGSGTETVIHLDPENQETIYLVGTTTWGCMDTLAIEPTYTTLEQLLPLEFPNIITPNGDLVNDVWSPSLPDGFSTCVRLSVFNRWGSPVFDSSTFPIEWNGKTQSGHPLSDGVYFYVLEIGGVYKKGTVTIAK